MENKPNFINRDIFFKTAKHLANKEITLIIGPRQVGKTVLLGQLKDYLITEKKVFPENIYNFNLDIIRDREALSNQTEFIRFIEQRSKKSKIYIFVDEAQKVENAGVFFKGVYDSNLNVKLALTGSSTLEIRSKIHESLAGRKRVFHLLPFAFNEILKFRNPDIFALINQKEALIEADKKKCAELFFDYCVYGGYPQAVLAEDPAEKGEYLKEIFTSYVEKDIIGFLRVENESNFIKLVSLLAAQIGQLANIGELSALANTDRYTIGRYLSNLEKTFITFNLKPFYTNARQEIVKAGKIYFIDNGLRNSSLDDFRVPFARRTDKGGLMENAILKELLNLKYGRNFNLKFWRTKQKAEVDFIVEKGNELLPVEAKVNSASGKIGASLAGFIERYSPKKALVVNMEYQGRRKIGRTEVHFILPYEMANFL
ncbi:ATP-binding protein [Patescibacteria group bacterium]|nr:ATP-binding protein [Patescibacteria group bacterium]